MQSREPYGKPMFEPIWEAAAAHGLPVAVHINGGNGVDHAPTFAGHAHTYPGYASFMPLNYFVHLATLIVEGVFGRHPGPEIRFRRRRIRHPHPADVATGHLLAVDARPDAVGRPLSQRVPARPCPVLLVGIRRADSMSAQMQRWMDFSGKADLLMYGSSYPHWSTSTPDVTAAGLDDAQRDEDLMAERQ